MTDFLLKLNLIGACCTRIEVVIIHASAAHKSLAHLP